MITLQNLKIYNFGSNTWVRHAGLFKYRILGFQVFIPDDLPGNGKNESGTWHVKGIVSNALARTHENVCDPEQYVVFTDVEKFLDWITQYTDQ